MGICEGLGKPAFLVVGNDTQAPQFVQNHLYLRTNLKDEELLTISLSLFVDDFLANRYKPLSIPKADKPLRTKTIQLKKYITEIQTLRTSGDSSKVEQLIAEILKKLNIQVVSNQSKSQDKGVDFVIWDDNLASMIGNPLFIEIKYGSLSPQKIFQAELQLRGYLEKSDARASILLYLDREGKRFSEKYSLSPLILRFDLEDFVREISSSSFEETMISKRNSMVHGVS
jgi:Restriction endonuclease